MRFLAYASGNLGKHIVWATADLTLLFVLTDLLRIPPTLAGFITLLGLVVDAVLDLVVGAAAQRGRIPLRRYGALIGFGAPAFAGLFVLVYSLPVLGTENHLLIASAVLLFRASYSLVDIPHNALITQVAGSSRPRLRVATYRSMFSNISALIIASAAPLIVGRTQDPTRTVWLVIGAAALSLTTLWMSWNAARRPTAPNGRQPAAPSWASSLTMILHDRDARVLLCLLFLTGLAPPLFGKGFIYYARYVAADPRSLSWGLTGLATGQIVGLPCWNWIAARTEKASALAGGYLVASAGLAAVWLTASGAVAVALGCFVIGVGYAAIFALPWAMAPDLVDALEARGGRRPEAFTFALLILVMKVGIGIGTLLISGALSIGDYIPDAAQHQHARQLIIAVTSLVPMLGCVAAAAVATRYRINHSDHERYLLNGAVRRSG